MRRSRSAPRSAPRSPLGTWASVPSRVAPGDHADEADSALPALRGLLAPATLSTIRRLAAPPRANPGDIGEGGRGGDDEDADDGIGFAELIPLARLVTGQWGRLPREQGETYGTKLAEWIGPQVGRKPFPRRLPVLRENPDGGPRGAPGEVRQGQWLDLPFFDRMEALRAALVALEERARARYDREAAARRAAVKRGWEIALRQCRGDVEWVLSQRPLAEAGRARVVERDGEGPEAPVRAVLGIDPTITPRFDLSRRLGHARGFSPPPDRSDAFVPQRERRPWSVISAKGNQKLPFASYSTLPMASCPSAGGCSVELVPSLQRTVPRPSAGASSAEAARIRAENAARPLVKDGYCYSFTAWRYPDSFARQFRNCLAEFADREFAIYAGLRARGERGPTPPPRALAERVKLAYAGRAARSWHAFCRQIVERDLAPNILPAREGGKPAFMRLYVDGDINSEDNIFEWMVVCAELQRTRLVAGERVLHPGIQVYGYSKCWDQFLMLDRRRVETLLPGGWGAVGAFVAAKRADVGDPYGGASFAWPENYTLNMSGDSVWNARAAEREGTPVSRNNARITIAMARLPVARGYFTSIDLRKSIAPLAAQFARGALAAIPTPPTRDIPFPFNEARMRAVLDMNARLSAETVRALPSRAAQEEALLAVYRELVERYQLGRFVRARVPRVKAEHATGTRLAKTDAEMVNELAETLLHSLYKGWFHALFVHGADPSMRALYASSEGDGGRPVSFGDIVLRELARDAVGLGEKPLSPKDYVESERQERMQRSLQAILAKMEDRGRVERAARLTGEDAGPKTLARAILFADAVAVKLADRLRTPGAIDARLREAGVPAPQRAKFLRDFSPEEFARTFGGLRDYQQKALAVALHEVLWTFGLGGSCPLVCGNCFDTPTPPAPNTDAYLNARHRCASRDAFRATTIHIGRH